MAKKEQLLIWLKSNNIESGQITGVVLLFLLDNMKAVLLKARRPDTAHAVSDVLRLDVCVCTNRGEVVTQ